MNLELSSAKKLLGDVFTGVYRKLSTLESIQWAAEHVRLSMDVSTVKTGKFNALVFPSLEYVYNCLDNPYIPIIYCIKSARFGWTTATLIWICKTIKEWPRNILFCFGTIDAARKFDKDQWRPFISGIPSFTAIINIGLSASKIPWNHITYFGGFMRYISTRIITNIKSTNAPIIILEEPDNHVSEVNSEGDLLGIILERMKNVPVVLRKFIVGGTPTIEGLSRIGKLMTTSNDMVFKAECHHCFALIPMDYTFFQNFRWGLWADGREHKQFGKFDPTTVQWICPECKGEWSFEEKNKNIIAGKKYGFVDHTGVFSKGWHPMNPEITEIFGFRGSECMSPLKESNFVEMSKKILAAMYALEKGNEGLMVTVFNNMYGWPYRTAKLSITEEVLQNYYSTYEAGIAPYEALVPYLSIDVQRDRLAFVINVIGRGNNVYTVDWFEIWGEVSSFDSHLWLEAWEVIRKGVKHISGITLNYNGVAIDCQDGITAEYVYNFCSFVKAQGFLPIYAVRGVNTLRFSNDPIFAIPNQATSFSFKAKEKTLAESYGIVPYQMGTHACQSKVMQFLENKTKKDLNNEPKKTDILHFTHFEREDFLNQMTGCILVPFTSRGVSSFKWELPSGRRMEALACVKMNFWLATKDGLFNYSEGDWDRLDQALR